MHKIAIAVLLIAAMPVIAVAECIPFPLDVDNGTFDLYTTNSNDGYSSYRGVVFTCDEATLVCGAELWTKSTGGLNATFEIYSIVITSGYVLGGATMVGSFNAFLQGDLGFHGGELDEPITMDAGQSYLLRVGYSESADENWFFEFDPVVFGHDPVDLGRFTVIDGTLGGDTGNFVMPLMSLLIDETTAVDSATWGQLKQLY